MCVWSGSSLLRGPGSGRACFLNGLDRGGGVGWGGGGGDWGRKFQERAGQCGCQAFKTDKQNTSYFIVYF